MAALQKSFGPTAKFGDPTASGCASGSAERGGMEHRFEELPGWTFKMDEVSAGVYEVVAGDHAGHAVSAKGNDLDSLVEWCRNEARRIYAGGCVGPSSVIPTAATSTVARPMASWLRLTLITLTVGGGFGGAVLTLDAFISSRVMSAAVASLYTAFFVLYIFVMASGLALVLNDRRIKPLIVALAIQVPVFSSRVIAYQFASGLYAGAGLSETGLFAQFRLGFQWQCNLLQPLPLGFGINFVPVVLLILLIRSAGRSR